MTASRVSPAEVPVLVAQCPIAAVLALGSVLIPAGLAAQSVTQPSLDDALAEFQLHESSGPVSEMLPGWAPPKKLVVVVDNPQRESWLQQAMPPGVEVVAVNTDAEAHEEIEDADAVIQSRCIPKYFEGARRLKWIHAGGAGSDQCLAIDGVSTGKVVVTNSQKVKNTALAEMALGHVFAMARAIDVAVDNQRARRIGALGDRPGKRLAGSTMLIVGLGGAGTEIARLAHGLGMKIIATRNSTRAGPDFVSYVGLVDELPDLIGQADIVIICAPLTPDTRGLFDLAMLKRMKHDAILINWTRTEIVVMKDLDYALRNGMLGSAAVNWATYEPLLQDDNLWTTPNLLLTPWGGSGVPMEDSPVDERIGEMRWLVVRENMRRFADGEKLYSVFDVQRGY